MITTIIILSVLLLISLFVIRNLLFKNEKAEDIILYNQEYMKKISEVVDLSNIQLKKIDEKGTFKSDDEVGFFFESLKQLQEILNQFNLNKK